MKIKLYTIIASIAISFPFSIPCFAQEAQPDTMKIRALVEEGKVFFNKHDYGHAAEIGKQIIEAGRRDSSIYFMTSFAIAMSGNKTEAKLYYDSAVTKGHDPNGDDQMVKMVIGLDQPPAASKLNVDSAFDAIHADAIKKAKHLPAKYKNAKLYQIYLEDQGERSLLISQGTGKTMNM